MKILITGGCGFIGVNLTRYLLKKGNYEITILDNFSVRKKEYLEEAIGDLPNKHIVKGRNKLFSPQIDRPDRRDVSNVKIRHFYLEIYKAKDEGIEIIEKS